MAGPWEKYGQQSAPASPVIAPPNPYKQASEQRAQAGEARAQQDQAMQQERLDLARNAEARAASAAAQGTESERTAGFLAGRVVDAVGRLSGGVQADASAASPTLGVEATRKVFGDTAANYLTDDQRQVVNAAQIDIIDAALTLGTGAAYTREQLEGYREAYFPKLGDSPAAIASKREALRSLLVNARTKAGRAAPDIDKALEALDALDNAPPAAAGGGTGEEWTREKSIDLWGREYVTEDGKPLGPDGGYAQDKETGEWVLVGRTTDDSPAPPTENLGPDGKPRVTGNDPGYAQIAAGVGDLVQGVLNNTVGLIANPINTNLFRALGYEGYTSDIGATAREGLGLPYGNETIGAINQAATGGLGGAGMANALSRNVAPGLARNALAAYGSRPVLDTVTGGSAAFSGEAARQMGAGPVGQAVATVAGGAAPSALMGSRNALLNMSGRTPPPDFDAGVVRAGERQNVPIRLPDAVPSERGRMANAAQTPHGGPTIAAARAADQDVVEARVQDLGGDGAVRDNYAMGATVQRAADRHIARTRAQANRLYERARELAGDARVTPRNADAALDRHIQELRQAGENTNGGAIQYLEGLRNDIDRGLTIESVQNLRSNMRGQINGRNLTGTDTERRTRDVIEAMNQDLAEQLPDGASQALEGADQFYRARMEFIDQVSQRFIGADNNRVPAETAAQRLLSMVNGKGDAQRFARMWGELEPDEQADLSATIAASLGRKANGDFSLSTLVRSLDPGKGINPRTARLVFGEDGARALADLRAIAAAKTATQQGMNNSNTGATVTRAAGGLKTLMLGALGYSAGGPVGAVAGGLSRDFISRLGEQRTARLLLNPDFTRWLRNAPDTANPRAIDSYFRRLGTSAAKSQVLAGDVKALQETLAEAFSRSPGRLAAAEQEQD